MIEFLTDNEMAGRRFLIAELPELRQRALAGNADSKDVLRLLVTLEDETQALRDHLTPFFGPGDGIYCNVSKLALHHLNQRELLLKTITTNWECLKDAVRELPNAEDVFARAAQFETARNP